MPTQLNTVFVPTSPGTRAREKPNVMLSAIYYLERAERRWKDARDRREAKREESEE